MSTADPPAEDAPTTNSSAKPTPANTQPPLRAVASWILYDLANTIYALGILSLFLPIWVVTVMGGRDIDYSIALSISMGIILVLSPLLGALTDQAPRRLPFLIVSTIVCVSFTALLGQGGLWWTLAAFVVANIAYNAGLQFYDSLLPEVSTEANRGKIGGIGVGVGYGGSLVAVAIGALFIGDPQTLTTAELSAQYTSAFQAVAAGFLLFALPCFIFVRERPRHNRRFTLASVGAAARQVGHTIRASGRYPGLVRFLVGRVFYTDAINTVIVFMGIYITTEAGFAQDEVPIVLLTSIIFAIIGGLSLSQIVDRLGPKRTLDMVLFLWMFIFTLAALIGFGLLPGVLFWGVACLAGIGLGGVVTADRPYMLRITPPARVGEFYGLYGMVGRFSAITGPLVWGLVVDQLGWGRPVAILTLLLGIVISFVILRGVSDDRRTWQGEDA